MACLIDTFSICGAKRKTYITENVTNDVVSLDTTETNNSSVCLVMQNTLEIEVNASANVKRHIYVAFDVLRENC